MVLIVGIVGLILNIGSALVIHGEIIRQQFDDFIWCICPDHGGHGHSDDAATLVIEELGDIELLRYDDIVRVCYCYLFSRFIMYFTACRTQSHNRPPCPSTPTQHESIRCSYSSLRRCSEQYVSWLLDISKSEGQLLRHCCHCLRPCYLEAGVAESILCWPCSISRNQFHHLRQCNSNKYDPLYLVYYIQAADMIPAMKASRILLEATPLHLDLKKVKNDLTSVWLSLHDYAFSIEYNYLDSRCLLHPWLARLAPFPIVRLLHNMQRTPVSF